MEFTKDSINYCLLTWDFYEDEHINSYGDQDITVTGLYNWSKVFAGKRTFPRTREDFSKYNIIHINLTPKNLPLISKILPKIDRNKTKLLINVDFAIELWATNFQSPHLMLQELDKADYIFGVEETMCGILEKTLKRKVPCIPHPSPIEEIVKYKKPERQKKIMISGHRYDMNYLLPWYAMNNAELDESWVTSCVGCYSDKSRVVHLYDEIHGYLPFLDLMELTSKHYCAIESYMLHSYGRFTIECAALGVPCIGTNLVSSMRQCFPALCHEVNDVEHQTELIRDLTNDLGLHKAVGEKGIKESYYYSFENCSKLMLSFLNSSQ